MNNYKLLIQYDGHNYNGWQKQGNTSNTIQGILELVISDYLGEQISPDKNTGKLHATDTQIEIHGSGRTDAGVHALGQVACFKTKFAICSDDLLMDLNNRLPKDIRILQVEQVSNSFHARLDAAGKLYSYYIDNGTVPNVFKNNYTFRVATPLNLAAMKKAALLLEGEHDFKSFCTKSNSKKSTIRTIYDITITEQQGIIRICYHGNGFLYNMIRILSGTLIDIGHGKYSYDAIHDLFIKKDRILAGPTVPANALFLDKVEY